MHNIFHTCPLRGLNNMYTYYNTLMYYYEQVCIYIDTFMNYVRDYNIMLRIDCIDRRVISCVLLEQHLKSIKKKRKYQHSNRTRVGGENVCRERV